MNILEKTDFKVLRTLVNNNKCVIRYKYEGKNQNFVHEERTNCESYLKIKTLQELKKSLRNRKN